MKALYPESGFLIQVESLRTTARVFNGGEGSGSPKCAECGQRLDMPAVGIEPG